MADSASQQTAPDAKIHAASRATSDAPPARPASPTKPTLSTAGKISQKFGRPLWNSTRPAPSAAAPPSANKRPVTPSGRRANTTLGDASAANATSFNATAIGADARGRPLRDENRPPLPTPASAGPKTLKHQSSILAGLGFGRVVSGESSQGRFVSAESTASTSPRKLLKPARVQFTDGAFAGYDPDKEPIKSYLRIRPSIGGSASRQTYMHIVAPTEVVLSPPAPPGVSPPASFEPSTHALEPGSARYKFSQVFGPTVSQADFFRCTALPLVGELLNGKSGLCFAYGVTASGKTYTVQGGSHGDDPGILPRSMDAVFNSVGPRQTDQPIRPTRLNGVELVSPAEMGGRHRLPGVRDLRNQLASSPTGERDSSAFALDDGSEYSVWVSVAEIYNEKVYDLLDSCTVSPSSSSSSLHSFTASLAEQVKQAAQHLQKAATGSASGVVKRKALSLKHDRSNGHKYISGLTELRVWSAEEAKSLLRKGQINRSVFSTLANRTSSRSHSIVTIRVIRLPKSSPSADPASLLPHATVSRLSVVDLAGSERTRNTGTTGERLKEAGNINKSLMVLGQCMEVLRRNQDLRSRHLASASAPLAPGKLAVVPFRHSKLTELFQSFFTVGGAGGGRAVMIVNANPSETGFDENMHVMKFSAVASEVATTRERTPTPVAAPIVGSRLELGGGGGLQVPAAALEQTSERSIVVEEDEDEDSDEDDADVFVDHLLDQLSALRVKMVEAEIRATMIEAEVRERVMKEMSVQIQEMEDAYAVRLASEIREMEDRMDRKIDIIARANVARRSVDDDEEEDEEQDEEDEEQDEDDDDAEEEEEADGEDDDDGTETLDTPRSPLNTRPADVTPLVVEDSPTPAGTSVAVDVSLSSEFHSAYSHAAGDSPASSAPQTPARIPGSYASRRQTAADEAAAVDDSMVIPSSGSSKRGKPKRQLRKAKAQDVDALESITNTFSPPARKVKKSASSRSVTRTR